MKIARLLRATSLFETLAQKVHLSPPWNPTTQDYYGNSGKAGDIPHVYQDYEDPKLTPLDYGDQEKPESPFADAPGVIDGSYTDWKPQYYRNIDPTYRDVPTNQQVKYQPGQKPTAPPQQKEPLPQYLMRAVNTLKAGKQLSAADTNLWKQYQSILKARWEQLKKLPTPTVPQQQERDMLAFAFGKMSPGIQA